MQSDQTLVSSGLFTQETEETPYKRRLGLVHQPNKTQIPQITRRRVMMNRQCEWRQVRKCHDKENMQYKRGKKPQNEFTKIRPPMPQQQRWMKTR